MPQFTSRFVDSTPGDPLRNDHRPRPVHGALWSEVEPTPVRAPRLLIHSESLREELGLLGEALEGPEWTEVLAGNRLLPGMRPYAANYGGHQFGHWAGQLGDGRAITLGELVVERGPGQELQLKGAGPTPYSRRGDGRAVLRSSLREFLCSEAMHALGVPTTRALSLVSTGEQVIRDMFYDGHPAPEPGAVVCRVARSFLRFGNFELPASRDERPVLESLIRFTLENLFPELDRSPGEPLEARVRALYLEVSRRTARLMAHWQAVGFVHGVMNTDNMSILGLTIDYGPYGWTEDFNPDWTPNTTDAEHGRYRYGNQPGIGLWNVQRLGMALLPLVGGDRSLLEAGADVYGRCFEDEIERRFAAKLGLESLSGQGDEERVNALFGWLAAEETDMTLFFRGLSTLVRASEFPERFPEPLASAFYRTPSAAHLEVGVGWLRDWWSRVRSGGRPAEAVARSMDQVNPLYVPRNYLAQEAIDAAEGGDTSKLTALMEVMRRPFEEQPGREHYADKRPDWARSRPGCSALSCSS